MLLDRTRTESSSSSASSEAETGSVLEPPPFFEHFLVVGVPPSFAELQVKVLFEEMQRVESANQVRVLIRISSILYEYVNVVCTCIF